MGMGSVTNSTVNVLAAFDSGSGPMLHAGTDDYVLRWTGTSWTWLGFPDDTFNGPVYALNGYDDGTGPTLYAGGSFDHMVWSGQPMNAVAKLVNGHWQQVGGGLPASPTSALVWSLVAFDDGGGKQLYVGGGFNTYSTFLSDSLLRWNGSAWSEVGTGLVGVSPYAPYVVAMCPYDDGTGPALYVAGLFSAAGGVAAKCIAKWNGTTWSPLGSGLVGSQYAGANALAVYDDGTGPALYVGGWFDYAGGVPANGLAKWNGTTWSAIPGLAADPTNHVVTLAVHNDGNGNALYADGYFSIPSLPSIVGPRRWDGSTWSTLGTGPSSGNDLYSMLSFDDAQGGGPALVVAGEFAFVGGNLLSWHVARWLACTQPIEAICAGDGSFATCPCSNYGSNLHGCANSASTSGALLAHSGTTSPDTLSLISSAEPSSSLSIFLQGDSLRPAPRLFGDGILCLGGQLRRMYLANAVAGTVQAPGPGDLSITQRSAALGDPIAPGSVRNYQVWYRDRVASFCTQSAGSTFNISNGLRVVW
jgi:hypothetical protein